MLPVIHSRGRPVRRCRVGSLALTPTGAPKQRCVSCLARKGCLVRSVYRSRNLIPAMSAMRSSSAGHAYRNGDSTCPPGRLQPHSGATRPVGYDVKRIESDVVRTHMKRQHSGTWWKKSKVDDVQFMAKTPSGLR